MKKKISFLVGLLLFFGVFYYTGGTELLNILSRANLFYLSLGLLLQLSIIYLYTIRLKIILSSQNYNLGFKEVFKILVAGMSVNQLTPIARAGGEPVKMYYISKNDVPATKSTASVIIEITAELISIYTTLLLVIFFLSSIQYLSTKYLFISIPVVGAFTVAMVLIFRFLLKEENIKNFIQKYILRFFKTKKKIPTKDFTYSLRTLLKHRKLQFKIFSLSFIARVLEILRIYFLLIAINYPSIFFLVLAAWALQFLFSMIPWLPGGLGLIEGGTISALVLLGIPMKISSSLILLDRVLSFWLPIFLGFITLYFLKKEFAGKKISI